MSVWQDQSGKQRNAVQADPASAPFLVTDCAGKLPCVRFNAQSFMTFPAPVNGLSEMTIVLVSADRSDLDGDWNGSANATVYWDETIPWSGIFLSPFQRVVKFRFGTGQVNNLPSYTRPASLGTQPSVTVAIKQGSRETLYVNGSSVYENSSAVPAVAGVADQGYLGRGYASTYYNGDLFELLVYSRALSDGERQSVENYLKNKYLIDSARAPASGTLVVTAGPDQTLAQPGTASLQGSATVDGVPSNSLAYSWTLVSGPAPVTFSPSTAAASIASFSAPGTYQLRLSASNGVLSGSATSNITVNQTALSPATPQRTVATTASRQVVYPPRSGVFNVRDFGAVGDGVNDDTAAIKAAMAAALGRDSRRQTVYFPAGTYLVSDTLVWAEDGTVPAQVTATVDPARGCITGFNILSGGHGFRPAWDGSGPGIFLVGGGGSGANVRSRLSGDSLASIAVPNGCAGRGYSSPPTVRVVNWRAYLAFQGESQSTTVIKLKDNAPGFADSGCNLSTTETAPTSYCRSVIYTASQNDNNSFGAGENGYVNNIEDLTIDTGSGNPGAVGIDWLGSNTAVIRNVAILSDDLRGRAGLNLTRNLGGGGGGPAYVRDLAVDGFDYGIRSGDAVEVGYTLEHITLSNQRIAGIFNMHLGLWIRDLSSTNSVPAVINRNGSMVMLDSHLNGGSPSNPAIVNQGVSPLGILTVRNVATSGYSGGISQGLGTSSFGALIAGAYVSEYISTFAPSLFQSSPRTLSLPVSETPPEYVDNDFTRWANVVDYGATPNDDKDDTGPIQSALNSGRPIVFLPAGNYFITGTLHIPSSVRKIVGVLANLSGYSKTATFPVFSCESAGPDPVEIRNLLIDYTTVGTPGIVNACTAPLVLADLYGVRGITNIPGKGNQLYLENVSITGLVVQHGGSLWARQLDIEMNGGHLENDGANVWILGMKTEGPPTTAYAPGAFLYTHSGGNSELLGGFFSVQSLLAGPAFLIDNSNATFSSTTMYCCTSPVIREIRSGTTLDFWNNGVWAGGTGFGLYSANHQ